MNPAASIDAVLMLKSNISDIIALGKRVLIHGHAGTACQQHQSEQRDENLFLEYERDSSGGLEG